jgi:hypothetical protein
MMEILGRMDGHRARPPKERKEIEKAKEKQ